MKKYELWCKGEDEHKTQVLYNRQAEGCAHIKFVLEGYESIMPGKKILAESKDYWSLVALAQRHEHETGHETEII